MGACSAKIDLPQGYTVDISSGKDMNDLHFRLENRHLYRKADRAKLDRLASKAIHVMSIQNPQQIIDGRSQQESKP